ncbi:MAG: hypothetical protein K0S42_3463, partial [Microvirga sp.]|nr:hypothetical protein [Microvirga sp.]
MLYCATLVEAEARRSKGGIWKVFMTSACPAGSASDE